MRDFINGGFAAELNILCSTGPLCRTLRDMDFFMQQILGQKPHLNDPRLVPIPWTGLKTAMDITVKRPLKVGLMLNDGVIQPQPPVVRALQWAKARLESSALVELKPFTAYRTADAMTMIRQMYWPDGGQLVKRAAAASGEPLHALTKYIIKDAEGEQKNAEQITKDRVKRDAFRCSFAENWTEQDVDVVLCPMFVGPAPAHDTSFYWNYTALWNFVDYPGAIFPTPITTKAKGEERYADNSPWNDQDAHVRKLWEEHEYEGAPIALQLVARKHHDNFLFGALDVLKGPLELK
jgi:amidase